jgi:hypothetical protein
LKLAAAAAAGREVMAWMRMMGAESVAYHRATVLERGDDHPGQALAYYASRGETPLVWGGSGSGRLNLTGAVSGESYEALYGPGGARHPETGLISPHFRDLRDPANTFAEATGPGTGDLMARTGHASPVAGIGYRQAGRVEKCDIILIDERAGTTG